MVWRQHRLALSSQVILATYASGGYSMKEKGDHYGLHFLRVSWVIGDNKNVKDKS